MSDFWTAKSRVLIAVLSVSVAFSQGQGGGAAQGGGGGAAAGGNTGGAAGGTGRDPGGFPGNNTPGNIPGRGQQPGQDDPFGRNQQQRFPDMQRPIFLSGKVVTSDGTPPPDSVTIERICNGQVRPEGYTDSKGRFSFELGRNQNMMQDASVSNTGDGFGGFGGQQQRGNSPFGGAAGGGLTERDLMGCEIRASLPGYRSDVVNLSGRRFMDNPDVGTIVIRRLAGVEGTTISMTTLQAPKDAKKAYEKAANSIKKKKWDDAQKELDKAVTVYPKYAVAWHLLGQLHQQGGRADEARAAYQKSIEADDKYVSPYLQLALMAANDQKWEDVADMTAKVTKLNPMDFPQAFFYNSVANYNLQKFEDAESSAREAVKLDTQHRMPKAQHILGVLLAMKNDLNGAAENMRGYLQFAPQAQDADMVKKQLTDIENRLGQTEVVQKQEP
ncbi:MAG: tetratricopeptide repeat protein [Bryobacteraceae bacterium]